MRIDDSACAQKLVDEFRYDDLYSVKKISFSLSSELEDSELMTWLIRTLCVL